MIKNCVLYFILTSEIPSTNGGTFNGFVYGVFSDFYAETI